MLTHQVPYLLSLASETPNLDKHLQSLDNIKNYERVSVKFTQYPGHLSKWKHVPRDLDPERYVVFMDTDDVRVQKPFPLFKHDLYLAPENVIHKDTIFNDWILGSMPEFTHLLDKEIINIGTFATKVKYLYEFVEYLENSPCKNEMSDQLHFNCWVRERVDLSKVYDISIFCPLYANVYKNNVSKINGVWMFKDSVICAAHANGSPELKKDLWE